MQLVASVRPSVRLSVRLSVCPFVCALMAEPFDLRPSSFAWGICIARMRSIGILIINWDVTK